MKLHYFDYNATHPPLAEIMRKNLALWEENPANPSGISLPSQQNQRRIEEARADIVRLLGPGLSPGNFHFVATGTEAVYQMVHTYASPGDSVLISAVEHSAMKAACQDFKLEVDFVSVDRQGLVDLEEVRNKLSAKRYAFVSVLSVSNETGALEPVSEIAAIAREAGTPFLSDCAQAQGKVRLDYSLFDAFTVNGHKFGAGFVAGLYTRRPAKPLFRGGLQENEKRAGTENLFSIVNMRDALALQESGLDSKNQRLREIQKRIEQELEALGAVTAGPRPELRSANTSYLVFSEQDLDFLFMGLDRAGIVVSTGSSCKSRTRQPSGVLLAMGYSKEEAMRAVRISTGIFTTEDQAAFLLESFKGILKAIGRPKAPV